MLKEAKRLYQLGFAVHWLKPGSKVPVKGGWSSPTHDAFSTLSRTYRKGYGLGVRLGEASKLGEGYLAVIDLDLKSDDPAHREEALAVIDRVFPGVREKAPFVASGRGNGSGHFYVISRSPSKSGKLGSSPIRVKVFSPTSEITKAQRRAVEERLLTEDELARGFRVKNAWEVEFMSVGKQVVLPPSVHPDTGTAYRWDRPIRSVDSIPVVEIKGGTDVARQSSAGRSTGPLGSGVITDFKPVPVDLIGSPLSDRIVDMILTGEGVEDRSAACFSVSLAMLKAGFSENEILSVLTDPETFLGETAYDHRKTRSRSNAAAWVRDYCIRKAREEVSAARAFEVEVEVLPPLSDGDAEAQSEELTAPTDWRDLLTRSGKDGDGPPKCTLENVVIVLRNAVSPGVFRRDLFASRDAYGCDAPWGGKKGTALTDDDAVLIKLWLADHFRFEPSVNTVFEAMTVISLDNAFHPVRDELEALPDWDGVNRLDTWLATHFSAQGNREYLAQVFRKWLVASIARVFNPGIKFDWMPIFEGAQGTGKSSFGAILFGQQYFTDWLPELSDKDAALGLQGMRCVEFGELDSLRKNEIETVKAFVTRQVDKVRPPYGRKSVEIHRQCVFFGTTNRSEYLKDDTGNRRFNPIEVGKLDFDALRRDRDQLWAEALFIYREGLESSFYLEGEAEAYAKKIQAEKMVADESVFMIERLKTFIEKEKLKPEKDRFNFERFKIVSLFGVGGPFEDVQENARNLAFASKAVMGLGASRKKSKGYSYWKIGVGVRGLKNNPYPEKTPKRS